MSPRSAIVTEGLSNAYVLGERTLRYQTLRENITSAVTAPFRRREPKPALRDFWALKDVSLRIEHGEAVGFIGRNGAGKTTLLKVLSRITDPTHGWAEVEGRVGALLEVGTGFHPELTGRENIFLNGAILGMSRAETRRKFDEIVAFAGVEPFLDTPVKRFSSGMTVRLAFAVAAHLEPQVLIVDEVLAVGDVDFQKKCISKMHDVAGEGRTVLFVSHNLAIVQALCTRAVHLEEGHCVQDGPTATVVDHYLASLEQAATEDLLARTDRDRRSYHEVKLAGVHVTAGAGAGGLTSGGAARFEFTLTGVPLGAACEFLLCDHLGLPVAKFDSATTSLDDVVDGSLGPMFVCEVDVLPLTPGRYRVDAIVRGNSHVQDGLQGAAYFDVAEGILAGRPVTGDELAPVAIAHRWRVPPT
jgi:lipopolysaccharide transport system ATP-binding protein